MGWLWALFLGFSQGLRAESNALAALPPEPDGPALAAMLCSMEPLEDSEIRGHLQVKRKKTSYEVPILCKVTRKAAGWEALFEAGAGEATGAERLIIVHAPGQAIEYLYARAQTPGGALPESAFVSAAAAAATGFAGSDYSLADLGLDFLRWPLQERLPDRTRLDRACFVLESVNSQAPEFVRVRSYIDKEYSGVLGAQGFPAVLVAEAFDVGDHKAKVFSLHGSSFKKVNGRYRLEKMEISNEKTGSQTVMRFD